jgi:hypothetical protein
MWALPCAVASPMTYELQGTVSGSIGNTSFTGASLTLLGTGDTTGSIGDVMGNTYNNLSSLTLSVSGFGPAVAVDPIQFFSSESSALVGFTDVNEGTDIFDVSGTALASYDGVSKLSATAVNEFFLASFPMTLGTVNLTSAIDLAFSAVQPVPLPAAAWLMLSSLGGLAAMARKRGAA